MAHGSYVTIQVDRIKHATDRAFLCIIGGEEVWLPCSQVNDPNAFQSGDEDVEMEITEWIAEQKGLL